MKEKKLIYKVVAFWLFILAIVSAYLLVFKSKDFKYGLDLNGGTSLTYVADLSKINQINEQANLATTTISTTTGQRLATIDSTKINVEDSMNGLRDVIEKRVNTFGVSEAIIRTEYSVYNNEHRLIVELPGIDNLDEAIKIIGDTPNLEFKLVDGTMDQNNLVSSTTKLIDTGITGKLLKKATLSFDQYSNKPLVVISFNDEGKKLFADLTKNNIGKQVAIYLDGNAISAPTIQQEISQGEATISGNFSLAEAKQLVTRLNSGALPVPIVLSTSQIVSPTLGAQAKTDAYQAGLIALLVIMALMVIWYRLPGLLSSIALVIYVILVLSLFKIFSVVLTAAGIAGFIISIGIAIDANILIFERLKEEITSGKEIHEATEEAFHRA